MELALRSLGPFGVLKPPLVCVCPVCVMILVVRNGILALPASVPGRRAPTKKPVISRVASWGEGVVAVLLLLGYGHCFSQCCVLLHSLCQVYLKGLTEEGVLSSRKLLCCIVLQDGSIASRMLVRLVCDMYSEAFPTRQRVR